jgi:predicted CoA-binding protein
MPNHPDRITELLQQAKTIAVVGLSDNPMRTSYDVSEYMQRQGYRIIPVNPAISSALGHRQCLPPLRFRARDRR